MQSNLTVYFACTSNNCKHLKFLSVKKRPKKKDVASSGLLQTFDILFYDFQTINRQKFSLILFYSTLRPFFGYFYPSIKTRNCFCIIHFCLMLNNSNKEIVADYTNYIYIIYINIMNYWLLLLLTFCIFEMFNIIVACSMQRQILNRV